MKLERLQYAKINGPGVTLAYMADDKTHVRHCHFDKSDLMFLQKDPLEALVRSLLLVFVDNATAEYSFISTFFNAHPTLAPAEPAAPPSAVLSPDGGTFTELLSPSISEFGSKAPMSSTTPGLGGFVSFVAKSKEEQAAIDTIWKQVMEPVMEYCTVHTIKTSSSVDYR